MKCSVDPWMGFQPERWRPPRPFWRRAAGGVFFRFFLVIADCHQKKKRETHNTPTTLLLLLNRPYATATKGGDRARHDATVSTYGFRQRSVMCGIACMMAHWTQIDEIFPTVGLFHPAEVYWCSIDYYFLTWHLFGLWKWQLCDLWVMSYQSIGYVAWAYLSSGMIILRHLICAIFMLRRPISRFSDLFSTFWRLWTHCDHLWQLSSW